MDQPNKVDEPVRVQWRKAPPTPEEIAEVEERNHAAKAVWYSDLGPFFLYVITFAILIAVTILVIYICEWFKSSK